MSFRMFLALSLLGLLFSGCLLFPVGDPEESKIDLNLLGHWQDEAGDGLLLMPFDQRAYVLIQMHKGEVNKSTDNPPYKAFITQIGDDTYLNLQPLLADMLFNPALMPAERLDELAAEVVEDKIEDESIRESRRKIVRNAAKQTGMVPAYMVWKIERKDNALHVRQFEGKEDDPAYLKLDSIQAVRQYILTHPDNFQPEVVYQFVPPKQDADQPVQKEP